MRVSVRLLAAVTAVATGLSAAGCGDTVLDTTNVEETVQQSLEKSLHEKIRAVDCPSDQKVEAGATFACTVDFTKGKQAQATLKILNEDADLKIVDLESKPQERGE